VAAKKSAAKKSAKSAVAKKTVKKATTIRPGSRAHALTNTFSGVAGEARVAAELVRCGIRVAKPYWTDDEIDLLVLAKSGTHVVPVSVQVKSVQKMLGDGDDVPDVYTQGLKKRYVAKNDFLCLAIYRPDKDRIWFIDGSDNIKEVRESQALRKRKAFEDLGDDDDVSIRVDESLDSWIVPPDDAAWIAHRIQRLANRVAAIAAETAQLSLMWATTDPP
jgi:hypothetical protein